MLDDSSYSRQQLEFIEAARNPVGRKPRPWPEVASLFNKRFSESHGPDSIRRSFQKFRYIIEVTDGDGVARASRETFTARRNAGRNARKLREVLRGEENVQTFESAIREVVAELKATPIKIPKFTPDKTKNKMAMELLISDFHIGKLVEEEGKITFNLAVATRRAKELTRVFLTELWKTQRINSVTQIVLALMGDIVESSTMHGEESLKGSEFGNMRQIKEASLLIFREIIAPIASTGIPITIPAVTGNHDRTSRKRTYVKPGEDNITHAIYHWIKSLCEAHGLNNVKWEIPTGPSVILNIFGSNILYEHGDNLKGPHKKAMETLIAARSRQFGKIIHMGRFGHFHEDGASNRGRYVTNGSLPGPDGFSQGLGYTSHPGQMITFLMEDTTKRRPNCFYGSFPVFLE